MGIIFDIKEFSVHDGPGVRQTVFLKGCPLSCVWCHNPEGQNPTPELLIRRHECIHCGKCASVCEKMAFTKYSNQDIIADNCNICGKCINSCPKHIRYVCGEEISPENLAKRILYYSKEYESMKGGVTFSGGEPLLQAEFLLKTMTLIPHVHKAIETSGFAHPDTFKEVFKASDLTICDIKLMNKNDHLKYTGVDNSLILQNIDYMKSSNKGFLIRIPLIPGITDTEENLTAAAEFLKDAHNLICVELLPYNVMAGAKYELVNKEYPLKYQENSQNYYFSVKDIFISRGIKLIESNH